MTTIKHIYTFALSAIALVITAAACTHDRTEEVASSGALTFAFGINSLNAESVTRAAISPEQGETDVQSLHLFFFQSTSDQSGTLVETVSPSGTLTMETTYMLEATTTITASDAYQVFGVANIEAYVDDPQAWVEQWSGVTEEYFRDNATLNLTGRSDETDYSTSAIQSTTLLMTGELYKAAGIRSIQLMLTRKVARLDVVNSINTTYDLISTSIWNAYMHASVTDDVAFDYSYSNADDRTGRFYGVKTAASTGSNSVVTYNNLLGQLYTFKNISSAPTSNDKITTTLIIGMRQRTSETEEGTGEVRYYRVNVNVQSSGQMLKDNHVYRTTIVGVTGQGYSTESEAYEASSNELLYVVNSWDLDDNGMIVSDQHSILALPVKTVQIGAAGGEYSYTVTTYSTLSSPATLRIKSQFFEPSGKITATLSGGALVINASQLGTGETLRSGVITLSYAGLETSLNIYQAASVDTYFEVTLDEGWTDTLSPTANAMSEYVYVNASGAWSAQLYGDEGFAFKNSLGDYVTRISSDEFPLSRFHIYTSSANENATTLRKGFALITLDDDPANYVAVVSIYQSPKGDISILPAATAVEFDGNGDLATGNENVFTIESAGTVTASSIRIVGQNYDKFAFTYNSDLKTVTVTPTGYNSTTSSYTATLVISDSANGSITVTLVQTAL